MSDQTHGGGSLDDDTLIRSTGGFYNGQPPAASPSGRAAGTNGASGSGAPTLAERIMHRLPAPPEKVKARQEYDQRQRQAEAARMRELEELRRADAERAAAKAAAATPPPAAGAGAAAPRVAPPAAGAAAGTAAGAPAAGVAAGAAATTATRRHDPVPNDGPARQAAATAVTSAGVAPGPAAAPAPAIATRAARRTRKARLRIARIDPWSVMKTFFLFSIASGIAFVTFIALLYMLIDGSGLFDQVDEMVQIVFGQPNDDTPFRIRQVAGWERVMGISALLACINVVILTALATLGSFLYNLSATMLGGLELTLAED